MGGPSLVSLVEQFVFHFKEVNLLGRDKFHVDRNEVVSEVFFKCGPHSKTGRSGQKGCFLMVFFPFTCRGVSFKEGEGGGNSSSLVCVYVLVQIVVVGKIQPEGFCLVGGAIKGIWRGIKQFLICCSCCCFR